MRGAEENGHVCTIVNVTKLKISPCIGCIRCGYNGPCVQKDDMKKLREQILACDMLMFATPLYYYGMSAQLKTVVDRFCAFNFELTDMQKKSALLTVAWNSDDWTFEALAAHYNTLVRYLHFRDMGRVLGCGCGSPSMTKGSAYLKKAYELGKSV